MRYEGPGYVIDFAKASEGGKIVLSFDPSAEFILSIVEWAQDMVFSQLIREIAACVFVEACRSRPGGNAVNITLPKPALAAKVKH